MIKLLFASSNQHKIEEIRSIIPCKYELVSLSDIGFTEEIPETSTTIEGNAIQKATFLSQKLDIPCFADDTGLCISTLNGEPGVYSARYAGDKKNTKDNIELVLKKLQGKSNREAYFETVIALYIHGEIHVFSGKVEGKITQDCKGTNGFGYDPIYQPNGFTKTFAELTSDEKNQLSHRKLALTKMMTYLEQK